MRLIDVLQYGKIHRKTVISCTVQCLNYFILGSKVFATAIVTHWK